MATLRARVSDARQLVLELRRLSVDHPFEGLIVVGYGADGHPCGMAANQQHRALSWMKVWELVGLADELAAHSVTLLVFPAGPAPVPSAHEIAVFRDLQARARRAGLPLLDCHVWRGERMWSLRELHEERVSA